VIVAPTIPPAPPAIKWRHLKPASETIAVVVFGSPRMELSGWREEAKDCDAGCGINEDTLCTCALWSAISLFGPPFLTLSQLERVCLLGSLPAFF
jgi:hypothetical protein